VDEPHRQHWTRPGPFEVESGRAIDSPVTAFETWGSLDADGGNAVLLTTGLSPSAHAARHGPDDEPGWWEEMLGPGGPIDTDRWFVVCANVLGGCHGSTGPASTNPGTGRPYALDFPVITLRDIMRLQRDLLDHLGVDRLHAVVGSSMGGMLALEFTALFPDAVDRLISISASGMTHPYAIALRHVQRRAVTLDPAWRDGDYYDHGQPFEGLSLAREIGTISYRSDIEWTRRFGRAWRLLAGVKRIRARPLLMGVTTDVLIPPFELYELADAFTAAANPAELLVLDLDTGHDSFLIHPETFGPPIRRFLEAGPAG